MAHIQKLPNGKFRISMCVERQRASRVVTAKSMKDAERQAVLMEEKLRETGSLDGVTAKELRNMTFSELCDRYISYQTEERNKPVRLKTHQKYLDIIKYQLTPFFNGMRVRNITERDINAFMAWIKSPNARYNTTKKKRYSDGTIKDAFTLLYGMMKYAVEKLHVISENPCSGVDKPTIEDRGEVVYYDNVQLETLLKTVDKDTEISLAGIDAKELTGRYKPFTLQKERIQVLYKKASIYLAVYTAARRGEVLGIHRQDINFETGVIHFCHDVIYTKKDGIVMLPYLKSVKENYIPVNKDMLDILSELIAELDKLFELGEGVIPYTDRLFMGLNTTRLHEPGGLPFPDRYSESFKEFLERYNLPPITFHKLRHSSISYMLYMGVDPAVVSKIASHNSLEQIQKTYGHIYDKQVNDVAHVFNTIKKGDRVNEQGREAESSISGTGQGGSSQGD